MVKVTLQFDTNEQAAAALLKLEGLVVEKSPVKMDAEKPKKEKAPTPAPTPEAAPAIDLGEEAPVEKAVTMEDLVKAAQAYSKKHGRENAAKIVAKFGVKSIREIKPENFAKVLNALAV